MSFIICIAMIPFALRGALDDASLVRQVADRILDSYSTEYRDIRDGAVYDKADNLPNDADIRLCSDYANWHYTTGIINSTLLEYAALSGEEKYVSYVKQQTDFCLEEYRKIRPMVSPTGDWHPMYGLRRYDELDFVGTQCGALMELEGWLGTDEYEEWIQRAADHIRHRQQRMEDGTLVRTWPKINTLWADDLYMGLCFMTRYYLSYADREMLNDAVHQVDRFNHYLWDEKASLFWHGWFSDTKTVAGAHWGRCNGWILKATVELLEVLEEGTPEYNRVLTYLQRQVDGLKKYQRSNGMWMQVLDRKSYEEASCSVIFVGSIAHAIRRGWLDTSYSNIIYDAWNTIKTRYYKDGMLQKVCVGTGIEDGVKAYQSRPVKDGDTHGAGLLLYAGMEMLALEAYLSGNTDCLLRPTFASCSVEWNTPAPLEDFELTYRKVGQKRWQNVHPLPYFHDQPGYRTSILRLEENSYYEVRAMQGGRQVFNGRFRTWESDVPIAKTIVIDPDKARYPIRINVKGEKDGWVRYTVEKGKVLKNEGRTPTIIVDGADHILIDNIVFKGPHIHEGALVIKNSRAVRIRNCELSDFGRIGEFRFDKKGKPCLGNSIINFDAAIQIHKGSTEVVVERCYVHDAAGKTNSWRYSHPAGTEAVLLYKPDHSTVIRYNDFIGSDIHRFNDAVESFGNFDKDGGFNRDADVYGNFMAFCNDDCIELDGGQRNVRCFDNRFESSFVGISIQGCMMSPSFVFNNVLSGLCDQFGRGGFGIKTGSGAHGPEARTYISENYFGARTNGIQMMSTLEADVRNNVFTRGASVQKLEESPSSKLEDNIFGASYEEKDLPALYPFRPLPYVLSRQKITDPENEFSVTLLPLPEMKEDVCFEIHQNEDFNWFKVSPSIGILRPGQSQVLTVTLLPEQMKDRRYYRGAFLVRTPDGLSRPFTIYKETEYVPPFHAEKEGDVAVYLDPFNPSGGLAATEDDITAISGKSVVLRKDSDEILEWKFTVPKTGRYYILTHGRGRPFCKIEVSVNGGEFLSSGQQTDPRYMYWTILAPGGDFNNRIVWYDFRAGEEQTLRIRSGNNESSKLLYMDGLVVTDNPESFEPK